MLKNAFIILSCLTVQFSCLGDTPKPVLAPLGGPPITNEMVVAYCGQIAFLASHPAILDKLDHEELKKIQNNICGIGLAYRLSANDSAALKRNETKLIGMIISSLYHRIDWNIDLTKVYPWLPAEPYPVDPQKQKIWEAQAHEMQKAREIASAQGAVRVTLSNVIDQQRGYLGRWYPDQNDLVATLRTAKIDEKVIYLLTHPYAPADYDLPDRR